MMDELPGTCNMMYTVCAHIYIYMIYNCEN